VKLKGRPKAKAAAWARLTLRHEGLGIKQG